MQPGLRVRGLVLVTAILGITLAVLMISRAKTQPARQQSHESPCRVLQRYARQCKTSPLPSFAPSQIAGGSIPRSEFFRGRGASALHGKRCNGFKGTQEGQHDTTGARALVDALLAGRRRPRFGIPGTQNLAILDVCATRPKSVSC